jgi:hypothetical protein
MVCTGYISVPRNITCQDGTWVALTCDLSVCLALRYRIQDLSVSFRTMGLWCWRGGLHLLSTVSNGMAGFRPPNVLGLLPYMVG